MVAQEPGGFREVRQSKWVRVVQSLRNLEGGDRVSVLFAFIMQTPTPAVRPADRARGGERSRNRRSARPRSSASRLLAASQSNSSRTSSPSFRARAREIPAIEHANPSSVIRRVDGHQRRPSSRNGRSGWAIAAADFQRSRGCFSRALRGSGRAPRGRRAGGPGAGRGGARGSSGRRWPGSGRSRGTGTCRQQVVERRPRAVDVGRLLDVAEVADVVGRDEARPSRRCPPGGSGRRSRRCRGSSWPGRSRRA